MATTIDRGVISSARGNEVVKITQLDSTYQTVYSGACSLFYVKMDNRANGSAVFLKMWDAAAPTVGTDAPFVILPARASAESWFEAPEGVAFATNPTAACVTTPGTAGTTAPASDVTVTFYV